MRSSLTVWPYHEQEMIGDDVWLPSYTDVNLTARVLLPAKLSRSFTSRYSEHKKFQGEMKYTLRQAKTIEKQE